MVCGFLMMLGAGSANPVPFYFFGGGWHFFSHSTRIASLTKAEKDKSSSVAHFEYLRCSFFDIVIDTLCGVLGVMFFCLHNQ